MKKVLFFISGNTVGGHEYQTAELILDVRRYCEVTVFLNTAKQESLFKQRGINYILYDKPYFRDGMFLFQFLYSLFNSYRLRKLAKIFDLIIVSAGAAEAGISIGFALWKKNICLYVPTFMDRIPLWGHIGFLYNCLLPVFIFPYKMIVTINRFQAKYFSKYKQTWIIPNRVFHINTKNINTDKMRETRKLYFVGRFDKNKRIFELIDWLDNETNKFKLLFIVGDGGEMENIVEKSKLTKYIKIVLTGWINREEQERLFTRNDVFVTNSALEGEPLVIREANERGSLVIARNIWGHRGCTHINNRFNSKSELTKLVDLAYKNELCRFKNKSIEEINSKRDDIIHKIFI